MSEEPKESKEPTVDQATDKSKDPTVDQSTEESKEEKEEPTYKMPDDSIITDLSKATNIPEEFIRAELTKAIQQKDIAGDPSISKMQNLQKLTTDPPKIPGLDILTAEPKATLAATKLLDRVITSISDPQLTQNIIDNITKMVELSLENKINKIEYLKNDTKQLKEHKDNSTIINSIHNETLSHKPLQVAVKGGNKPFFTEEECSFF
jgi:hypothetical protein